MAFLEGLLGGGDPYALYGDLLNDKQRAALRSQQMGQGLLRMAGAFAEAAKPSLMPTGGIGSALGRAAGALAGHEDEALKGLMTAGQIRELQSKAKLRDQLFSPAALAEQAALMARINGAAAPTMPPGPSTAGPTTPPPAPSATPAPDDNDLARLWGIPGDTPGATGAAPPLSGPPTPAERALWIQSRSQGGQGTIEDFVASQRAGGGGPPDQVIPRRSSLGDPNAGFLSLASYGGAPNGMRPPTLAAASSSPGAAGGDILDTVERYESGGRNIHQGIVSPDVSSAQGYYQITNSTWRDTAPKAGVDLGKYPTAMAAPKDVQRAVAEQLYSERGAQPWAAFNPALAKAIGYAGASFRGERPADIVLPSGGGDGGGQLQALQALMQLTKSPGDTADEGGSDSLSALAQLTGDGSGGGGSSGGPDIVLPSSPGGLRATPASYNGTAAAGDDWLLQNAPFPTLRRPDTPPIQMTNELPKVPLGQAPGDFLPGGGPGAPATNLDTVIPSGRGLPASMLRRAQYSPGGGASGGVPGMPPVPTVPGVDPQAMNQLLIMLAQRNAAAEALGMGNPYGSLLSVLQGSPAYKGMIETATRGAGLPFVGPEAAAKAAGAFPYDMAGKQYQAALDRANKEVEMLGAARLDPAEILVEDGKGGKVTVQGTREQRVRASYGFAVPELGIPGIPAPGAAAGAAAGAPQAGAPQAGAPQAGALASKPFLSPGEIAAQQERGKAPYTFVDATIKLPGENQEREMKMSVEDYNKINAGQEVTINGVKIPAMTGIKLGKSVYSPEQTATIQAAGTAQAEMYKSGQKALDTAHEAVRAANQRTPYYGNMLAAMQAFQPGATAEARLTGMQYLKDLGIIKGDNVSQGEALKLAAERLAFLAVPPGQGSWAIVERQMLKNSIGSIALTPEGLTDAIRMMQQLDDYDRKVSEIHRKVADQNKGLPNLLEAQRQVEALGPPLTTAQQTALERLQQQPATPPAAPGGGGNATKSANEIIQNGWRYDATTHRPIGPVQ